MIANTEQAVYFFSARQDYFWRWAEHGRVIEFSNGRTVCYREDLAYLLGELSSDGQVSLGSVLLLLCAVKDNWESLFEVQRQLSLLSLSNRLAGEQYATAGRLAREAYAFLKIVNALPFEQRSGLRRSALIRLLVKGDVAPAAVGQTGSLKDLLARLNSGELDELIFGAARPLDFDTLEADLLPLSKALQAFPDTETLLLKLNTGLSALPAPAPLALPEEAGAALLGELEEDIKTQLLGRLTRQILAAIRIPMHLAGTGDYSLGGVADISNRGNFDQLLLSELAQDDLLLSARLANNEALYLQRELPPDRTAEELGIFMDATLKMWGMPRVLALATALAFREGKQANQHLQVWALGGQEPTLLDLERKTGVVAALEQLDPALDCAEVLRQAVKEHTLRKGKYVLITGADFLQDPAMQAVFHRIREQLNFLVTVQRNGHLQLFQLNRGRQKLLNEATVDLSDRLFRTTARRKQQERVTAAGMPAIFRETVFPLYYPTSKVKVERTNTFVTSTKEILIVTQDRRLLYWSDKAHGATELVESLPVGAFCFGELNSAVYMLVSSAKPAGLHLYSIDLKKEQSVHTVIEHTHDATYGIKFINYNFYLYSQHGLEILDQETLQYLSTTEEDLSVYKAHQPVIAHYHTLNAIKKQINNGYSVINSAKSIYLHTAGRLFMDKRGFQVDGPQLTWRENNLAAIEWVKPERQEAVEFAHLPHIKFTRFIWANGSEALLDSRGLLHLRSVDSRIPEVSILLVVDQPTACWSADGVVSGSVYFTGKTTTHRMDATTFYQDYIQRFIGALT